MVDFSVCYTIPFLGPLLANVRGVGVCSFTFSLDLAERGVTVCSFTGLDLVERGVIVCALNSPYLLERGANQCYF